MARFHIFFKQPKHQRFEYNPRFWDPDKEALKKRLDAIEKTKDGDAEAIKERITAGFRKGGTSGYMIGRQIQRKNRRQSNIMLLAIVGILILVFLVLINVYLPKITELLNTTPQG